MIRVAHSETQSRGERIVTWREDGAVAARGSEYTEQRPASRGHTDHPPTHAPLTRSCVAAVCSLQTAATQLPGLGLCMRSQI